MKEKAFALCFIGSLMISLFFLGSSITGFITSSMYCNQGKCYEQCRFASDCESGQVCCDSSTTGYCTEQCSSEYIYSPSIEQDVGANVYGPHTESPQSVSTLVLLFGIVAAIIALGLIYYIVYPVLD